MRLLEIYKEKNKNNDWLIGHSGSINQDSFMHQFLEFLEIENKPKEAWPKQKDHGQEIYEQYAVNMLQSKLFKKDKNNLYNRTAKGLLYNNFINLDIVGQERWFINYLFLLNGYYLNRKNYITNRVKEDLLGYLLRVDGITEDFLIQKAKELLKLNENSFSELLRNDFFYVHSFHNDLYFLINYFKSPDAEKEELAEYIEKNYETKQHKCCISEKYRVRGNFNQSLLIDETKVFLLTLLFIQSKNVNLNNIYDIFIDNFIKNIYNLDRELVFNYLNNNKNVFDSISEEILESKYAETSILGDC